MLMMIFQMGASESSNSFFIFSSSQPNEFKNNLWIFIIFAGEGGTAAVSSQVAASTSSLVGTEDDVGGALGSSSDPEHSSSLSGDLIHRDHRELDINDDETEDDQPGPHHPGSVPGK